MPLWRDADLEAVFGGPLDETGITRTSLAELVASRARESERLDFKEKLYPTQERLDGWGPEFAKDVASFANRLGGVIVFGIKDEDGVAGKLTPFQVPEGHDRTTQKLMHALMNFQAPLAERAFVWVTGPDGDFLAVVVPPSRRSPHAVVSDRKRDALRYPERHGVDTMWLTESEVAERYRRRLALHETQREVLDRIVDEGCAQLERTTGIWIFGAVVSDRESDAPLDSAMVKAVSEWFSAASTRGPPRPFHRHIWARDSGSEPGHLHRIVRSASYR